MHTYDGRWRHTLEEDCFEITSCILRCSSPDYSLVAIFSSPDYGLVAAANLQKKTIYVSIIAEIRTRDLPHPRSKLTT